MPKWARRCLPSFLKSDLNIDTGDDDDLRWNDENPMMMLAMGVVWIGLLGLITLGIFALIKYLKS